MFVNQYFTSVNKKVEKPPAGVFFLLYLCGNKITNQTKNQ